MKFFPEIGLQAPDTLIPKPFVNLYKWAVVACDQYTAQPEYWEEVEKLVGNRFSTYHLILPEAYLGTSKEKTHQASIPEKMRQYLTKQLFDSVEGFIYIEREINHIVRPGLVAALDLERYNYSKASTSLIRATEGTIIDRIPPRVKIREQALLEIPHIMVLIDDPNFAVIEPLCEWKRHFQKLYDFELMMDGGMARGYLVNNKQIESNLISAFHRLITPEYQLDRYGQQAASAPFLFAVGDGNHSLATAKVIWENIKSSVPADHPARFALVEIVNIHSPAIVFEPIHRIIKNGPDDILQDAKKIFQGDLEIFSFNDFASMADSVLRDLEKTHTVGVFSHAGFYSIRIIKPMHTLAVGNIQMFLDQLSTMHAGLEVDYIHGRDTIQTLGSQLGTTAFFLSAMRKDQLFTSVMRDGPLPRKTFSMGEAHEKRYYLETRLIQEYHYET